MANKEQPHRSDCAVHNEPALPKGECNCRGQRTNEEYIHILAEWTHPYQSIFEQPDVLHRFIDMLRTDLANK